MQRDFNTNREVGESSVAGQGSGQWERGFGDGERGTQEETEKRGRGPRRAEKEERDETKPKKAFYFSSLKNKKTNTLFQLTRNAPLPKALLGQEIRKPQR